MKKIFSSVIARVLLMLAICVVMPSKVSAQDVWVADWKGERVFVETHTFRNVSESDSRFHISVKFVFTDQRTREIRGDYDSMRYIFINEHNEIGWIYKNEHMGSYKPASSDLIASRVLNYCLNNLW